MFDRSRIIRRTLYGVIVLNMIVLALVFIFPRLSFMAANSSLEAEQLMETRGARDMPNQYAVTYKVVNRIRKMTASDAVVFMPPGHRVGSFRSAVAQRLFPRTVHFGDDGDFLESLSAAMKAGEGFLVYTANWLPDGCSHNIGFALGFSGIRICRLDGQTIR